MPSRPKDPAVLFDEIRKLIHESGYVILGYQIDVPPCGGECGGDGFHKEAPFMKFKLQSVEVVSDVK